ncbi:MAG: XdhC family protein [Acidobacteria bacterium]|nr:XdhC family protein [Acidobacteriota bacterium]
MPAPRVLLFGCGHLARAIGPMAEGLGFEVVLCDDNATGAIDQIPAWATQVVPSFSLRDVEKSLNRLGPRDYVLILTRDHAIDQRIVEETLERVADFDYVGLIGSLGKVGRFRKRVLAKGAVSEEQWQGLRAPIGLDICAETPQEIAVSIMAELIALKNAGGRP